MTRWVIDGAEYEVAPQSRSWTVGGAITYKVRRPRWRAEQHPRDRRGRFVEVGDPVVLLGGARGIFQGVDPASGRYRVRVGSQDRLVQRRHVTFDDSPAPKPAPKPAPAQGSPSAAAPSPSPAPPTGAAATGKATLVADSQRNTINSLNIDEPGSPWSQEAQAGAAALRNKKPMTAAQAEALADAVLDAAQTPGIPKPSKNSLNRGAERLRSLAARLRGFDPDKAPTAAQGATVTTPDKVTAGDVIALPGPGGSVQVREVVEASDFYGDFKFVLKDANGVTETRYVYPDTDLRNFPTAPSVAEALKQLDAQAGTPGAPKALYDDDKPDLDAFVDKLMQQVNGPPKTPAATAEPSLTAPPPLPEPATGPLPDKGPGAVQPSTQWYDHLGMSGKDTDPIPVTDLTIEGYTVKNGVAWRTGGRSYLVELKPGETQEQAVARGKAAAATLGGVLSSAPPDKAELQRGLALLQGSNPSDSYWAKKYDIPGFHSSMTGQFGGTTVWGGYDPKPTDLAHEFGHTVDSTAFGVDQWLSDHDGVAVPGQERSWKKAQIHDQVISAQSAEFKETRLHPFVKPITVGHSGLGVTGYGAVDPREDFAESVRLWMKDRREGKVGYLPSTKENVRFSDLFPERAKILDAVMGTTTDFHTPIRKRRRKETEDAILADLKKTGSDEDSVLKALTDSGLPVDEVKAAQMRAADRYAAFTKEQEAAKAAAELKKKLAAEKDAEKAKLEAEVANVTAALSAGHLAAADAKKFRAAVTRYKTKLRAQGYSESEIAHMAAAYETSLIHKQLGLGEYALPKASPQFSTNENTKANDLLGTAGGTQHPLSKKQWGEAEQAKANIAAELASRLNNPEDWERFMATTGYDEFLSFNGEKGGTFEELSQEDRQLYLDQEISKRVGTWAANSGDSNSAAVLMQEAVKQEFGLSAPSAPTMDKDAFDNLMANRWAQDGPFFRRVARAMYEHTQDEFAKAGIKRISVYRGMRFSTYKGIPDWAKTPGQRDVALQPVNSWSARRATSKKFVDTYGSGEHKVMLKASFPVELVLGSALTGFGCLNEQEYVIFDTDGDINVEVL